MEFVLANYLKEKQTRIDTELRKNLWHFAQGAPTSLIEAMEYSLLAPGKRLRPILVMMSCQACGGTDEQALPAACAVEMVHTYSLIHDDLPAMDDDDLRRGLPTCHKKFSESLAILAGDALLTMSFQVLAQRYSAAIAAVSISELASGSGAVGMVGGQVLDLAAEDRLGITQKKEKTPLQLKDLEGIHSRKTGALFRSCLRLGLYAAQGNRIEGIDSSLFQRLDAYSKSFGLCFQITDDLLDVEGNEEQTGKRVGKDAGRGKLTYPGLLGIAESRRLANELYSEAIQAVEGLGSPAKPLMELARFVIERDR